MLKRKKRQPKLSTLRDKLDDLFSKWVRLSEADACGYVACVTCGMRHPWKETDAGHFVPRRHLAVRWDERNVHAQCKRCNRFRRYEDMYADYAVWVIDNYGRDVLDELQSWRNIPVKLTRVDYEQRIDEMARKLAALVARPAADLHDTLQRYG